MKIVSSWLPRIYHAVVRCLFAAIILGLFLMSVVCIAYIEPSEYVYLCDDSAIMQAAVIAAACLAVFLLARCRTAEHISDAMDSGRTFFLLQLSLLAVACILGLFWVFSARFGAQADQGTLMDAAHGLRVGDYSLFEKGGYMSRYNHQVGLVLILHWLGLLWGDYNYTAFHLVNVLAYLSILWETGCLCQRFGLKNIWAAAAMLLTLLFLPLLFYTSFVYGSLLSLAASLLALRLTLEYLQDHRISRAVGAGAALFFAIVFKSNSMIFAIGLLIYCGILALRKSDRRAWLLLASLLLGFYASKTLPIAIGEAVTGCDLSQGLSPLAWIVMGLQDDGNQIPGWYNGYVWSSFTAAGEDPAVHQALLRADLKALLLDYAANPRHLLLAFAKKTAAQWCEPTFQGLWILQHMPQQAALPAWLEMLISPRFGVSVSRALNLLHIWILFGAMLRAFTPDSREEDWQATLLMMIFIGGFVFHTFWEAKSEYTFPYFVLLIPLALSGYRSLVPLSRELTPQFLRKPFRKNWYPLYASLVLLAFAVLISHFLPTDTLQVNLVRFYRSLQ